jgi:hypothetical protein
VELGPPLEEEVGQAFARERLDPSGKQGKVEARRRKALIHGRAL